MQPMSASQARSVFGATSTAAEVIDGVDLRGRRAVVTGASSGIGVETVRALATAGADVTLAVRNTGTGAAVADQLRAELPPESGELSVAQLELSDLSSVKAFAAAWDGPRRGHQRRGPLRAQPRQRGTPVERIRSPCALRLPASQTDLLGRPLPRAPDGDPREPRGGREDQ